MSNNCNKGITFPINSNDGCQCFCSDNMDDHTIISNDKFIDIPEKYKCYDSNECNNNCKCVSVGNDNICICDIKPPYERDIIDIENISDILYNKISTFCYTIDSIIILYGILSVIFGSFIHHLINTKKNNKSRVVNKPSNAVKNEYEDIINE